MQKAIGLACVRRIRHAYDVSPVAAGSRTGACPVCASKSATLAFIQSRAEEKHSTTLLGSKKPAPLRGPRRRCLPSRAPQRECPAHRRTCARPSDLSAWEALRGRTRGPAPACRASARHMRPADARAPELFATRPFQYPTRNRGSQTRSADLLHYLWMAHCPQSPAHLHVCAAVVCVRDGHAGPSPLAAGCSVTDLRPQQQLAVAIVVPMRQRRSTRACCLAALVC
jgi:hypothetical protein